MGQIQTLDELIGFLIRRRLIIVCVAILGTMLSLYIGVNRPKVYESAAVIQVTVPTVEAVPGMPAPTGGSGQLLQAIEQRLTTRDNLIEVIERHGLFADLAGLTMDQKVTLLRTSVRFQGVASVTNQTFGAPTVLSAILILARLDDPEQAARVANDFAQGILDLSNTGQSGRAQDTYRFYQDEAARVSQEIVALEAEIATYRNANADALPELRAAQTEELTGLEVGIRELNQALLGLRGERAAIERRETLRVTDRNAIDELTARIEVTETQKAALDARRTAIQSAIAATPEVDRALSGYERRQRQLQDQYLTISGRLAEAETAQRRADLQQDERFTLLERAITPEWSVASGGRKIAVAGAVGSLLLGIILAFVLELLNPVLRTRAQMQRELNILPVIAIPDLGQSFRSRPGLVAAVPTHLALPGAQRQQRALPRYAIIVVGAAIVLMVAAVAVV